MSLSHLKGRVNGFKLSNLLCSSLGDEGDTKDNGSANDHKDESETEGNAGERFVRGISHSLSLDIPSLSR